MRVHAIQHVPYEGLGTIERWLVSSGFGVDRTRIFAGDPFPDPSALDLLIVMGGPMSVHDEGEHSWLAAEKSLIRECIDSGKRVLGVCLGAQLIASVLGALVHRNHAKEIGWFPVEGIRSEESGIFRFPSTVDAFHWHGETFDLPAGAVHLARSAGCENQAFQFGRSVLGLQFHLETTPESVREMIENGRDEMTRGPFVQSESEILGAPSRRYSEANELMDRILRHLVESAGARGASR